MTILMPIHRKSREKKSMLHRESGKLLHVDDGRRLKNGIFSLHRKHKLHQRKRSDPHGALAALGLEFLENDESETGETTGYLRTAIRSLGFESSDVRPLLLNQPLTMAAEIP
jgi:hypothetical protein